MSKLTSTNNLAIRYPELSKEWNFLKNSLCPKDVTPGCNKKVWWICSEGHEWEANVKYRSSKRGGTNCPYCSRNKVSKINSLEINYPEVAKQWHPTKNKLDLKNVSMGSNKKVWWICSEGHEWKTDSYSRTSRGTNCPYCSGRCATKDNNLKVKYPEIAKEWHPIKNEDLIPDNFKPYSNKKVWWICAKGHEWKTNIRHRVFNNSNCPYCYGRYATKDNNLKVRFPEIARQWHPVKNGDLTPGNFKPYSNKKMWWICAKGHEWKANISTRANGSNCPNCYIFCNEQLCRSFFEKHFNSSFPSSRPKWLRDKSRIPLQLDGYNEFLKIAFEYQGSQHYNSNAYYNRFSKKLFKEQQERDLLKKDLCKKYGIKLFIIPYTIFGKNDKYEKKLINLENFIKSY